MTKQTSKSIVSRLALVSVCFLWLGQCQRIRAVGPCRLLRHPFMVRDPGRDGRYDREWGLHERAHRHDELVSGGTQLQPLYRAGPAGL